ncbi:MAG TPA: acyl carrier protein [Candidatus Acidoferrales bacterium]|jgi:acyl carrier protein|nr:acyl carrier protein [Candidatus Acidoferrales bacterium]
MNENDERLIRCFAAVFPDLSAQQIRNTSAETSDWNSLAAVTLVTLIEEEFGISIGMLDLAELDSFSAFERYVSAKCAAVQAER